MITPASPEDVEGLVANERAGEVAEVDDVDDLLGRHLRQQAPQLQAGALGAQVPQSVEDGAGGHVHDALLRAEPAQLRVVDGSRQARPRSERSSSASRPTTWSVSVAIAAVMTSLPRPIVKLKPWPWRPSAASVRSSTCAAE